MIGARKGRVFAAAKPTDLRKSFDTLTKVVVEELGRDILSGDAFLFVNARANRAKVLYYDGTGLVIVMKRLEKGRFAKPWARAADGAIKMSPSELALFLEGSQFVFLASLSPDDVVPGRVLRRALDA